MTADEAKLIEISVKELCANLQDRPELDHMKQCAFEYWAKDTGEEFQVQITVTRRKSDFLDAFQTEEMQSHL
jgi:hypothetical protein